MVRPAGRGIAAIVLLCAFWAAVPALSVTLGRPRWPRTLPDGAAVQRFLADPQWTQVAIGAAVVVLWLLWLATLYVAAARLAASAGRMRLPVPRLAMPLHQAMGSVLGASVVTTTMLTPPPASTGPAVESSNPAPSPAAPTAQDAAKPAAAVADASSVVLIIDGCGYQYPVVKGDTLWDIADKCLGDPQRWPQIWQLNQGRHWPNVSTRTFTDPDLIYPGWVLTLPPDATVPPTARPVEPAGNDGVTPPASHTPSQTPVPTPSANTGASATTAASAGTEDEAPDGEQTAPSPTGVSIPGGWITTAMAAALLAAAAMVYKHRRQQYKPTPVTVGYDEPHMQAPLAAATLLRRVVHRTAHPDLDDDDHTDTDLATLTTPTGTAAPSSAAAPRPATELAGHTAATPTPGVGLTGPGAAAAARGMLVAALTENGGGHAVVPVTTLAALLGTHALQIGPVGGLTITDTPAGAIAHLEEAIIRASRILADHDAADITALRHQTSRHQTSEYQTGDDETGEHESGEHHDSEELSPLLLIADAPDPAWRQRLAAALSIGASCGIDAVFLGAWPASTLTVAADGTTGHDSSRLATLDIAATMQMLAMLRQAHSGHRAPTIDTPAPTTTIPAPVPAPAPAPAPAPLSDHLEPSAAPAAPRQKFTEPATGALATGKVQIRILGAPAVLAADGQPAAGLRAKSVELLVYLAVNRGGAALADIKEALWPDVIVRRADERLSTCVANLRRIIRLTAAPPPTPDGGSQLEPVINTASRYHLNPDIVQVDWWHVIDAQTQAAKAADDTTRLHHLRQAINGLHGRFVDGHDYEWIDLDRENARRRQIDILAHAAELVTGTDPQQAATWYHHACQLDPLSDELARRFMRAAAHRDDTDALRRRLRILRHALADNGLTIQPETEQLARQLLDTTRTRAH